MATPVRMIEQNTTYLCQRKTSEGRFFLKPSKKANAIILYCLAWASKKHGVLIHEYLFQFNHYHMVLTDVHGNLPDFYRDFHAMLSRALGYLHRRPWPIWGKESYNACKLLSEEAALEAISYTLNNPIKDGLVSSLKKWLGLHSAKLQYGEVKRVQKPKIFFSENLPEYVEFQVTQVPKMEHISKQHIISITEFERQGFIKKHRNEGYRYMGINRLMKQSLTDSPESQRKLFRLRPTLKAKNKWLMLEAIQRKKDFNAAYQQALKTFQQREDKPRFPIGTYGLLRLGLVVT